MRHFVELPPPSGKDEPVRYVKDMTGRFAMRPHYEPAELDKECEKILSTFFDGRIPTPIDTDSLAQLIDRDTSDFDPGADLSRYGPDVEGVTEFLPNRKPKVRIVAELAYDEVRQNRYRTTLTHEYGHVHFHAYLFATEPRGGDLFSSAPAKGGEQVCKRDGIINARKTDWMEWQAGYVCGALLMPITQLRRVVSGYQETHGTLSANRGWKRARRRSDQYCSCRVSGFCRCGASSSYAALAYPGTGSRPFPLRLTPCRRDIHRGVGGRAP